ncbi:MAG: serine/threonine protein kinase, partial [Myxococcaceae bacterium]|nr:serine/threonine protein kinase [Myxococcaceae bacterium]
MSFDGRALERSSRYVLSAPLAEGGMATVHLARLIADEGFARTVAVKRLHATYARDPHFVRMFLEEARIAARVQHPNIVDTLDVVARDGELFVVMDYIHGESLSGLLMAAQQRKVRIPTRVVVSIVGGLLRGLHAAHEATNEKGEKLELIHRDVSPQNVFVGLDGFARVIDFGVAKALGRMQATREGEVKGKLSYMAPEQMLAQPIDRRADVFSAAIVLWEALTGQRLFFADDSVATMGLVMKAPLRPPSQLIPNLPAALDAVVLKGLERQKETRFQTALEMVTALEAAVVPATPQEVSHVVATLAGDLLTARAGLIRSLEDSTIPHTPMSNPVPVAKPQANVPTFSGTSPQQAEPLAPPARARPAWVMPVAALAVGLVAFVAGRLGATSP